MKSHKIYLVLSLVASFVFIAGCSATRHAANTQEGLQGDRITVGTVQREINKGMSGADVMEALGSPNIVSTDEQGREVWVYDKVATDRVYSESAGALTLLLFGPQGGGLLGASGRAGSASTSQRTLTIIIKFDHQKKVRDFAYHSSRF